MSTFSTTALAVSLALSLAAFGCAPHDAPPPVTSASAQASFASPPPPPSTAPAPAGGTASAPPHSGGSHSGGPGSGGPERHVYRFDFVLQGDASTGAPGTSFTLNLQEHEKGEMLVGKNVPLSATPPGAPGGGPGAGPPPSSPRQDVGLKVAVEFRMVGDDALLNVSLEMSSFDPPSTIRKVVAKGNALATLGKPALVTSLDDDKKHYQLTVTPTKLR